MRTRERSSAVSDLFDAWTSLLSESTQMSMDLLRAFTSGASSSAGTTSRTSRPQKSHGCSCTIPPACWLPVDAGEEVTHACPGATASLRIRVTNGGAVPREIAFEVAGSPAGVTLHPGVLHLGPLERGTSLISFALPPDAGEHHEFSFLIWIRGCKSHYVRWTVVAGEGDCRCRTISIEDCPETIHHWYDHFYCERPCQH